MNNIANYYFGLTATVTFSTLTYCGLTTEQSFLTENSEFGSLAKVRRLSVHTAQRQQKNISLH